MEKVLYVLDVVFTSRLFWTAVIIIGLTVVLQVWGFFTALRKIIWDCLIDHTPTGQGRVTIINLARFLTLLTTNVMMVVTHVGIELKPFKITTTPFNEWELFIYLSFVAGTQWIFSKFRTEELKQETTNTPSENG